MFITTINAQTVLLDNFNRSDNNTVGNGWTETETSSPSSIAISSNRLKMGSTTAGRDWAYQDISSNYTTAGLSSNTTMDSMVWAINFYQTRTDPSGFDKSNYGIAFVLGSTSSSYTDGNGYAVVLGNNKTPDPIRLVRFSGGIDSNKNLTNIISSGNYGKVYLSIKVTYKPSTNTWKLYAESSSDSFPRSDPRNTSKLIGTGTDNTYTGSSYNLKYLGCLWNHSTGSGNYALFDDIYIPKYLVTQFEDGDFVVLSLCSNIYSCQSGYSSGDDEISFMCFKNISKNDEFIITDNGYEHSNAGKWGTSEGTYKIKRTGGTIPAGTVITIRLRNTSPYFEGVYPDNNWSMTNIGWANTSVVLNSKGDQIYFLQGGTWYKGSEKDAHDATYTPGHYLFAFNTKDSWTSFGNSTQESGLVMGLECMSMMSGVATDFIIYTGSTDTASKIDWIRRVNNPANWTSFSGCSDYYDDNRHYQKSYGISTSVSGTYVWTGEKNNNWFDCGNWQNLKVPDTLANVIIPVNGVTNEVIIPAPPTTPILYHAAYCRDITIDSTRTFTLSNTDSKLWVYRNMNINTSFSLSQGLVVFKGSENGTLSIDDDVTAKFYNVEINKNTPSSKLYLADDNSSLIVKNQLALQKGIISNQNNNSSVIIENTSTSAISSHGLNSYVANKIRRYVNTTGSYDFPLGTHSYYEIGNINLNSATGITYIDGKFTTPIIPIDISSLGIFVNSTQLTELLNYGYWTFTQSGASSINYDITITSRGHTNQAATADAHAIVKRQDASHDWVSEGTHNNSDQAMGTDPNGTNWVRAKRSSLTSFSDFAIAKGNYPLPIELLYFDAFLENQQIKLKWATATEQNVSHFSIYRNNYTKNTQNAILNIPAFGNSNQLQEYIETDYNPVNGWNTYFLEEIDYDGSQTLVATDAIYYYIDKDLEYNYDKSSQTLSIHISENCDNYKSLFIYSIDGKILYNYDITNITDISIPLNISSSVILKFNICNTTQQYLLVP